ncbi:SGNH hydrolase-type esterase domain-containing protein [Elsinoe ampelina]|uniref:SGNH hydrolase-type esterase domain-containing protein n=1 Tax=Elsinoe ampelina TaxID=302913 RepID=A0A6A6GMQ8_9PEZI|nr:SGNH hydrolase-type esterase domain-containing protein [Elsinoe ampelina]
MEGFTRYVTTGTVIRHMQTSIKKFRWLGRVNPATRELTWPGTGVQFKFKGTKATIGLTAINGDNSFELLVDNAAPTIIRKVNTTSISTPQLLKGEHTVTLRRRSETALGTVSIGDITADGPTSATTAEKRQIEFIGDSITVGYGLDGVLPCVNDAAVTDNPRTYAALAATSLKADYHVIAWSGKGIVRNYGSGQVDTSPLMPELWTRYGANDATGNYPFPSSWNPSAVVINLGTNDFGYLNVRERLDIPTYTQAFVDFIGTISAKYKKASFFLLSSPMLSDGYPSVEDAQHTTQVNALKDAISKLNGTKAYFVDWPSQGSDVGCDYHPNAATHAAEAPVLAQAIKAAVGW